MITRVGELADAPSFETEVAALRLAAQAAIPVPRLLGHDDGTAGDVPLVLTECLPGSSQIPLEPDPSRLRVLGAVAARLHAVPLEPSPELPVRDRPLGVVDFARMRRKQETTGLLTEGEALIRQTPPTGSLSVLAHGDLWQGNTLWNDGTVSGVVDWDCAGTGAPGMDLGSLRCDVALCYGNQAAAEVLRCQEGASIDPRLVAVAVALAQRLPGRQLLRAHPLAVIQLVHVAGKHRVPARA